MGAKAIIEEYDLICDSEVMNTLGVAEDWLVGERARRKSVQQFESQLEVFKDGLKQKVHLEWLKYYKQVLHAMQDEHEEKYGEELKVPTSVYSEYKRQFRWVDRRDLIIVLSIPAILVLFFSLLALLRRM